MTGNQMPKRPSLTTDRPENFNFEEDVEYFLPVLFFMIRKTKVSQSISDFVGHLCWRIGSKKKTL